MVDDAPPPEEVLPVVAERLRRRVLVAHNASFDRRVLKQAFERAGIDWPDPPVLCTVAMGRRFAPLARQRKLALLAESLGIEVDETHRALPDALTCARIFCALFPKLCANAASLSDALRLLGPRRRPTPKAPPKIPREQRPGPLEAPRRPRRVRVPQRGRPAALRRQVGGGQVARPRPLLPARRVDRPGGGRRLHPDQLGARRARAREPADQAVEADRQPRAQADRPLGVSRLPARHPLPRARGRLRARGGPRGQHRPGQGPPGVPGPRGPGHVAVPAPPLRPQARDPRPPVAVRPDGPLRLALPRRPRPERLPPPARRGARPVRRSGRSGAAARRSSTRRWSAPPPSSTTSAPPSCATGASGSASCSRASAASYARSTPAPARCSRSIRSSRNGTSSGSRAAAWPNGAR